MNTLTIDVETYEPGIVAFKLSGSLDAAGTTILTEACEQHVASDKNKLIIHLADVGFVSSSGIGTLIMVSEDLEEAGGKVILAELSPEVESVFKILDLEDVMATAPTMEEALAAMQQQNNASKWSWLRR